jgi:Tfx family DNA-binding protein
MREEFDVDSFLERLGFDPDESVLTRRQATVLALRERGLQQSAIAERLGTSRANVANVEASARTNVDRARETVAFAEALRAPIRVPFEAGTDIYDVPDAVYAAADEADVTVEHGAPDLMKRVVDVAGEDVRDRVITAAIVVSVSRDGVVTVRRQREEGE